MNRWIGKEWEEGVLFGSSTVRLVTDGRAKAGVLGKSVGSSCAGASLVLSFALASSQT
jgi:hypothetical protein